MKTRLTLRPGQNGTKKLVAKYGPRLLSVRYRYDADRRLRFKTVELIEEQERWEPARPPGNPDELVLVRIGYAEGGLREAVKAAGGQWQQDRKLWRLKFGVVWTLGLEGRIVR